MRQFFPSLSKKPHGTELGGKAVSSQWVALALLCIAQFMVVLDVQVVVIALPAIQREFAMSQTSLQWVINAYVLVFGGFLMLVGIGYRVGCRASDIAHERKEHMPVGPKIGWFYVGYKGEKFRDIDLLNEARRHLYD
jgi:hypothetical protein